MKLYEVKVMVGTDESREWDKMHSDDDFCPRDLLATRPMLLNLETVTGMYPDKDKRVTTVELVGNSSFIIAMPYEMLKKLILETEPLTTK